MPAWERFSELDQEEIIRSTDDAIDPSAAARLRELITGGRNLLPVIRDEYGRELASICRITSP